MTELLIGFMIGFFVFVAWRVIQASNEMALSRDIINRALVQKYIVVRLEENEDGVFAYRFKDMEFLAQGRTFDEMAKNFKQRFPDKTGLVAYPPGLDKEIS